MKLPGFLCVHRADTDSTRRLLHLAATSIFDEFHEGHRGSRCRLNNAAIKHHRHFHFLTAVSAKRQLYTLRIRHCSERPATPPPNLRAATHMRLVDGLWLVRSQRCRSSQLVPTRCHLFPPATTANGRPNEKLGRKGHITKQYMT